MSSKLLVLFGILVELFAVINSRQLVDQNKTFFDVVDYGAIGDGITDNSRAFENAWNDACKSKASTPIMHVPRGKTYLLQPLKLSGGCNSKNLTLLIDGNLIAPMEPSAWRCDQQNCRHWLMITHVDGLFIRGSGGILNLQASKWWDHFLCQRQNIGCGKKPTGFILENCNNVHLSGLVFEDSPQMHIALERSTWVHATHLIIRAPGHSPNTDGIHIQHSQHVFIQDSQIETGDDCISIGDGSAHLNITRIFCGPGHGISIGSLGDHGSEETVEHVHVSDVTFNGTSNGARIKTWQGGKGYARDIIFERIDVFNSSHPIIIDQYYCTHRHCTDQPSAVQISNVVFSQINGTSHAETAVKLSCSKSHPCMGIEMKDVTINFTEKGKPTSSHCSNVRGRRNNNVFPSVSCLAEVENL